MKKTILAINLDKMFETIWIQQYLNKNVIINFYHNPSNELNMQHKITIIHLPKKSLTHINILSSMFSIYGYTSLLPDHLVQQLSLAKPNINYAIKKIIDLYCKQLFLLCYRLWIQSKLDISYFKISEPDKIEQQRTTQCNHYYDIIFLLTNKLKKSIILSQHLPLFALNSRSAKNLQLILQQHYGFPVTVQEYKFSWNYCNKTLCAYLYSCKKNCQLGINSVLYGRIWHRQQRVAIKIGPLHYNQLRLLLKNNKLIEMFELVQSYIPMNLTFAIEIELISKTVESSKISSKSNFYLGYNTWLFTLNNKTSIESLCLAC